MKVNVDEEKHLTLAFSIIFVVLVFAQPHSEHYLYLLDILSEVSKLSVGKYFCPDYGFMDYS